MGTLQEASRRGGLALGFPMAVGLALALSVAGCQSAPSESAPASAETESTEPEVDPELKALTDGIARDLEAHLQRGTTGGPARPTRPEIVWQDGSRSISMPSPNRNASQPESSGPMANTGGFAVPEIDQAEGPTARTPAATRPSEPALSEQVVALAARLRREAAYSSTPLQQHLAAAALLLTDPTRPADPDTLHDLTTAERATLEAYQNHFVELYEAVSSKGSLQDVTDLAERLARELAAGRNLSIADFRLCRRVVNFGHYDEIGTDEFVRGRRNEFITYIEIDNFQSELATDGLHHTKITQSVELYADADGTLVHSEPGRMAEDVCRKPRRDFFLVRHVVLPANLNVGTYRLKVRVKDESSGAEAEAVLPLRIVATASR